QFTIDDLSAKIESAKSTTTATTFTTYKIRKGQHYCDQNTLKSVSVTQMNFAAKFDNTGIYSTIDPVNQYDINKLWGFSEGLNHQYNSARIGWAWVNNAMRLYGYTYSKGVRYSAEICSIPLNTEIACSIKLNGSTYLITANGVSVTLPRGSTTTKASGYQLYPYFGGDETAPHDIFIYLKNL
ncbi:MAG: hypothetical protein ACO29O_04580, partial [Chitinophagaceae bacterium]